MNKIETVVSQKESEPENRKLGKEWRRTGSATIEAAMVTTKDYEI
jgi:hypothetical protein